MLTLGGVVIQQTYVIKVEVEQSHSFVILAWGNLKPFILTDGNVLREVAVMVETAHYTASVQLFSLIYKKHRHHGASIFTVTS